MKHTLAQLGMLLLNHAFATTLTEIVPAFAAFMKMKNKSKQKQTISRSKAEKESKK